MEYRIKLYQPTDDGNRVAISEITVSEEKMKDIIRKEFNLGEMDISIYAKV